MNEDIDHGESPVRSSDDVIHARLNSLHAEVDQLRFAPARLIRDRARARTRRRVAAVAAAVVLLAGAGYLGRGGPGFLHTQLPQPPAVSGSAGAPGPAPTGSAAPSSPVPSTGSVPSRGLVSSTGPVPSSATPSSGGPTRPGSTQAPDPAVTPMVVTPGGGPVPIGYFVPGRLWAGSDLDGGAATAFGGPFEPEGSITMYECDSARDGAGRSAFLPVAETGSGRPVGLQRVQLLATSAQAAAAVAAAGAALSACRPPAGANYTVEVLGPPASSPGSVTTGGLAGGHVVLARVRTTTLDTAERTTTWVAVVGVDGPAVTTLVVRQPPAVTAGWDTLQRLALAAAQQLQQAQGR